MLTYNVQANDTINSNPTLELKNKREKGIDSQTVYMPESEMQKIRYFFTKWEKEVGEKEARQEGFKILSKSTAIQIGTNKTLYPDDGKVYLSDQSPRTIGQCSDFADAPMTSYDEGLDISHIKIIWN